MMLYFLLFVLLLDLGLYLIHMPQLRKVDALSCVHLSVMLICVGGTLEKMPVLKMLLIQFLLVQLAVGLILKRREYMSILKL